MCDCFHFSVTKRMGLMHSIIRPREFLSELLGRKFQSLGYIIHYWFYLTYSGTFIMVIIAKSGGLSLAILSARCILVSYP